MLDLRFVGMGFITQNCAIGLKTLVPFSQISGISSSINLTDKSKFFIELQPDCRAILFEKKDDTLWRIWFVDCNVDLEAIIVLTHFENKVIVQGRTFWQDRTVSLLVKSVPVILNLVTTEDSACPIEVDDNSFSPDEENSFLECNCEVIEI
jgi:hypothetical protein